MVNKANNMYLKSFQRNILNIDSFRSWKLTSILSGRHFFYNLLSYDLHVGKIDLDLPKIFV